MVELQKTKLRNLTICKDDCAVAAHDIKLFSRGPKHFAFILIFDLTEDQNSRYYICWPIAYLPIVVYMHTTRTVWYYFSIVLLLVNKQNCLLDAESHRIIWGS